MKRGGRAYNVVSDTIRAHDRVRGQGAAGPAKLLALVKRCDDEVNPLRIGWVRGRPQQQAE